MCCSILQIDLLSCFLIWQTWHTWHTWHVQWTCQVSLHLIMHFNKSQQNMYIIVLSMLTFSILQNIEVQCTIFLVNANLDLFANMRGGTHLRCAISLCSGCRGKLYLDFVSPRHPHDFQLVKWKQEKLFQECHQCVAMVFCQYLYRCNWPLIVNQIWRPAYNV